MMGGMRAQTYRFRNRWHAPVSRATAYDVLSDLAAYERWWPQVRAVEKIDETTAYIVCRSLLPYHLSFRMQPTRQEPREGILEARLVGDLEGWCRWTLSDRPASAGGGTALLFEQEVTTTRRLLRQLAVVGRPVLVLNHAWMMRAGQRGLLRHLSPEAA